MEQNINRIKELKQEKNAVILAHYYQNSEIQDIADFVGDSLELAKKAKEAKESIIILCGVRFMAESAKLLNPNKTVLLSNYDAGCPMADMITPDKVNELKEQYPDAAVVCYVNSSAEVKAVSDVCCTSSNAVKIVDSLPEKRIIFIPDENLGQFVAKQLPDKEIITNMGYCITHKRVLADEIKTVREVMPGALIVVHPECSPEVIKEADFAGSTAQILKYIKESGNNTFVIGTEQGILHSIKKQNPDKKFYVLSPKLVCTNMKKTRLEDVLDCLENNSNEINIDEEVAKKAFKSINKMMQLS